MRRLAPSHVLMSSVFAAASPKYPEQLYAQGLCSKPAAFATATVVLIFPRATPARIRSVYDPDPAAIQPAPGAM